MAKHEIAGLMNDGSEAGFTWEVGEVSYEPNKGQKISLGDAPHAKVVDVAKFEENFPGVILAALNGTSIKVACQAVTRRAKLRDRKVSDESMRSLVLNSLRGIKNRSAVVVREVVKFMVGGQVFDTEEAARDAGREILQAKGLPEDMIEDILNDLVKAEVEEVTEE